jgi:hypothetical protein
MTETIPMSSTTGTPERLIASAGSSALPAHAAPAHAAPAHAVPIQPDPAESLHAALTRIVRLEQAVAELLMKNEQLRQQARLDQP